MFLHLGNNISVDTREIVAICDARLFQAKDASPDNLDFLDWEKKAKRVQDITTEQEKPKSLVITEKESYWSVISPMTLKHRADTFYGLLTE